MLFNVGQVRSQHATELEDLKKTLSSQESIISSQLQELCGVQVQLQATCVQLEAQEEEQKVLQENKAVELKTEIETIKRESEKVRVNKQLQKSNISIFFYVQAVSGYTIIFILFSESRRAPPARPEMSGRRSSNAHQQATRNNLGTEEKAAGS